MEHKKLSVGIIMDGNRRWAKEQGLPSLEGHRRGYEKLKDALGWCREFGVRDLIVYAFSTENWNRSKDEVSYLMDLLLKGLRDQVKEAKKDRFRIVIAGDRSRFSSEMQEVMRTAEEETKGFTEQTLALALSYGGRAEIIDAIHRIPKEKLSSITEDEFSTMLWSTSVGDPDMIIRTSGEQRLSGFLPWKGVYSELFFTDTYWPAFTKEEFARMLEAYGKRQRRFGT